MTERARSSGFTLLEVLVAMTIFSFIVVAVYSGLRVGSRSWESTSARIEQASRMRLVQDTLRRVLGGAYFPVRAVNEEQSVPFEGSRDELRFVTEMPSRAGPGGMYRVELSVEGFGDEKRLVLRRQLLHPELGEDELRQEVTLVEDLRELEFEYFGAEAARATERWQSRWEEAQAAPKLVRMRVVSETLGDWPDLLVRVYPDTARAAGLAARGLGGVRSSLQRARGGRAPATRSARPIGVPSRTR